MTALSNNLNNSLLTHFLSIVRNSKRFEEFKKERATKEKTEEEEEEGKKKKESSPVAPETTIPR